MKKLAFVLAVVLVFSFAAAAFAQGDQQDNSNNKSYWEKLTDFRSNPLAEAQQQQQQKPLKDEGGTFEKIVAALLEFPINVIQRTGAKALKLKTINDLVFGRGLWDENEAKFIRTWYWGFATVCLPFFLVVIVSTGFKLLYGAINPGARAEAIASVWRWFGAMVLILIAPLATDLLLQATGVLTDGIQTAYSHTIADISGRRLEDWGSGVFTADPNMQGQIVTGSVLGTAIVKLFFVGIWWWFNVIYLVRKFVLTAMLCFTPLMALFWAINRNVPAFAIWLGELASNALMPVAHALVLCLILGITDVKNVTSGGWFQILVAIGVFIPLTEVIRNSVQGLFVRWAGIDEAATAGRVTMAAMGLGGLLSLGRLAGTVGGSSLPGVPVSGGGAPGGSAGPGSGSLAPVPVAPPPPVPAGGGKGGPAPTPAGRPFSSVPAGYAATPAGLVVPSSALSGGGAPGQTAGLPGQPGSAGPGATGQPAAPATWKGKLGQAAARYGPKAADGLVKAGASAAGAVAGGVVRAGLSTVPGLAPVGERLGGAVSRGAAAGTRLTAGTAALGGRLLDAYRKGEIDKVFGSTLGEKAKNVGSALLGVTAGRIPVSAVIKASSLRSLPKYQAQVGGLNKRTP